MVKTKLSTFLDEQTHCSNLFSIFLKTSFSYIVLDCVMYDLPLNMSIWAENCTTAPLEYSPEVESAVLFSHISIRSNRVLNVKNLPLTKPSRTFVTRKKQSETSRHA
jgi:hypothetical protein